MSNEYKLELCWGVAVDPISKQIEEQRYNIYADKAKFFDRVKKQ